MKVVAPSLSPVGARICFEVVVSVEFLVLKLLSSFAGPSQAKEVLPGLYLAAKKDVDMYPESLLQQWGFSVAVAALEGEQFDDIMEGVRCIACNSNGECLFVSMHLLRYRI